MSFFSFLSIGEERETGKTSGGNLVVTVLVVLMWVVLIRGIGGSLRWSQGQK